MDMFLPLILNIRNPECDHASKVIRHWEKENATYVQILLPNRAALTCSAMTARELDVLRDQGKATDLCGHTQYHGGRDGPLYVADGVREEVGHRSGEIQASGVRGPRLPVTDMACPSFYIRRYDLFHG